MLRDLFRYHYIYGLNDSSIGHVTSRRITDCLELQDFEVSGQLTNSREFSVDNSSSSFQSALACEISQLSTASEECLLRIVPEDYSRQAIAWAIIRSYYSAFFSVHALLRACGTSCTFLDQNVCLSIGTFINAIYPGSLQPVRGYYLVECNTRDRNYRFRSITRSGGVHSETWRLFAVLLKEISSNQAASSGYFPEDVNALSDLWQVICLGGVNQGWMSGIRNRVNYMFDFGVWFPAERQAKAKRLKERIISRFRAGGTFQDCVREINAGDDLEKFTACVLSINAMRREVLDDIRSRCTKSKSFLDHLYYKFQNLVAVKGPN